MAFVQKKKQDFTLKIKNTLEHGENVVFIKGGSVIVDDRWVHYKDLRIDVQQVINSYVSATTRRLFNHYDDILYVLIGQDKSGSLKVFPSVSFNTTSFGDVRVFPDLSGLVPLMVVKLTQDGTNDLKSFIPIKRDDIELYQGYGNFTLRGPKGEEGYKGITGIQGVTGIDGLEGYMGFTGDIGETGIPGFSVQGVTGPDGPEGQKIDAFILDRG